MFTFPFYDDLCLYNYVMLHRRHVCVRSPSLCCFHGGAGLHTPLQGDWKCVRSDEHSSQGSLDSQIILETLLNGSVARVWFLPVQCVMQHMVEPAARWKSADSLMCCVMAKCYGSGFIVRGKPSHHSERGSALSCHGQHTLSPHIKLGEEKTPTSLSHYCNQSMIVQWEIIRLNTLKKYIGSSYSGWAPDVSTRRDFLWFS